MLTKKDVILLKNLVKSEINSSLDSKLKPINKRLSTIEKKLDKAIDIFDRHELEIVKNVKVIQHHLDIPIMEFA